MKHNNFIVTTLLSMLTACAFGQQLAPVLAKPDTMGSASSNGPFDKIWSVALSQFNQSNHWADSIAELTNGTLVAVGGDGGNQPNSCRGFFGGAWLIGVTQAGGKVFQKLYSNCANADQWATFVRSTLFRPYDDVLWHLSTSPPH